MEKNKTIAIVVVVVVVSSIALVAFWNTQPTPDVRIGYLSQDLHQLALKVAVEKGWFEEVGLTVELVSYQNGGYEMDGFAGGQIDMGYLGAAPALVKRINQQTMVTLLSAVNLEGSAIMAFKAEYDAGHVTSIEDLEGKTVYYPGPPTVQSFLLRLALNQSGLQFDDISAQSTSVAYMEDSLSESAPAFIAWEPFCAKAEHNGNAVPLLLSGDIWPEHPCCVVASSNTFLSEHPDIVQKVIGVHKRATEWMNSNVSGAKAIAADWLEMDSDAVSNAFDRIIYDFNINRTGIEIYLEFLIHEEQVDMELDQMASFLDSFIDTSFADAA